MVDDDGDIPRWIIVGIARMAISGTGGWIWYCRTKAMIASAGNAYLLYKGYSLSRALFNHGMWGHGRRLSKSTNNLIVDRLKRSSIMKNAISNIIKKQRGTELIQEEVLNLQQKIKSMRTCIIHCNMLTFQLKA